MYNRKNQYYSLLSESLINPIFEVVNNDKEKLETALAVVLRRHRSAQHISQEELAYRAGLHPTYISQLERGLKNITLKTLLKITHALKLGIVEIVAEIETERNDILTN